MIDWRYKMKFTTKPKRDLLGNCEALTTKKKPCSIPADRIYQGQLFCHLHDPAGTYQYQKALAESCDVCGRRIFKKDSVKKSVFTGLLVHEECADAETRMVGNQGRRRV